MKKTRLNGYVYEFCVDYEALNPLVNVTKALPIFHDYFMTKYKVKSFSLLKNVFYRINIFNKHKFIELYFNE